MPEKMCKKKHLTSFQYYSGICRCDPFGKYFTDASDFFGQSADAFHEALFTATSAVCVTGLVVKDSGSYWSVFGQTVILALIQIGGLGVEP